MNAKNLSVLCIVSLTVSGCATITSDEMQSLSLNTKTADGKVIENAKCTLTNDKGQWEMESPGFVNVRRSAEDLMVECKKEGNENGFLRAISRAAAGMFGNIIFGGGIGAIIDHSKGTGYNYPNELPVKMGASIIVDRKNENNQEQRKGDETAQAQANDGASLVN